MGSTQKRQRDMSLLPILTTHRPLFMHTLRSIPHHFFFFPKSPSQKTLNCLPISSIEHFRVEKLGFADLVEGVLLNDGKIVKIVGIKNMGRTTSVLVSGSNQMVLEEAERSLHDALCVVRCMVNKKFLISSGGAPEIKMSRQLGAWAKVL